MRRGKKSSSDVIVKQAKVLDRSRDARVGSLTRLDMNTPEGLFESSRGNRYIVVHEDTTIAVPLVHDRLPRFTMRPLGKRPLETGRWLDPYSLHLTSMLLGAERPLMPGLIGIHNRAASIDLLIFDSEICSIILGDVGSTGLKERYFNGWAVRPLEGDTTFFEQLPTERTDLTVYPTHMPRD